MQMPAALAPRCTSVAYTPPREYMCAKTAAQLPLAYKDAGARANERLRQHGGVVRGARGALPAQRLWHARRQQRLDRGAAAAEHGAGRRRRVPDAAADRGAPAGPHTGCIHPRAPARVAAEAGARLLVRPRARAWAEGDISQILTADGDDVAARAVAEEVNKSLALAA